MSGIGNGRQIGMEVSICPSLIIIPHRLALIAYQVTQVDILVLFRFMVTLPSAWCQSWNKSKLSPVLHGTLVPPRARSFPSSSAPSYLLGALLRHTDSWAPSQTSWVRTPWALAFKKHPSYVAVGGARNSGSWNCWVQTAFVLWLPRGPLCALMNWIRAEADVHTETQVSDSRPGYTGFVVRAVLWPWPGWGVLVVTPGGHSGE